MIDYAVVFDISREPFRWWPLWLAWALAFVALLAVFLPLSNDKPRAVNTAASICILALMTSAYFVFQFEAYERFRRDLASGNYSTAEGCVSHFTAAPVGSHRADRFVLAHREFEVGPKLVSPAYHDTVAQGARNLSGLNVKIRYVETDQIIWLGISGTCDRTPEARSG